MEEDLKCANTNISHIYEQPIEESKIYLMDHMKDIFEIFVEQHGFFPKYQIFRIGEHNNRPTGKVIPISYGQKTTWYMIPENQDEYKETINLFVHQVIEVKGYNFCTKTIIYNPKNHLCKGFGLMLGSENGDPSIFHQFSDPNFKHILVSQLI